MDQLASVLLDFPPAGGIADDERYHSLAKSHIQKVDKLVTPNFGEAAAQLLDVRGSRRQNWPCYY
jgi:COP9 signalosome complex subunit 3